MATRELRYCIGQDGSGAAILYDRDHYEIIETYTAAVPDSITNIVATDRRSAVATTLSGTEIIWKDPSPISD